MKYLAISLLRLGDILMLAPVITRWKQVHPDAKIHLLIYGQFKFVKDLMPMVDFWHFIDRNKLQSDLLNPEVNTLKPYNDLKVMLSEIDKENYEQIINFTHNSFSTYICSYLNANNKWGMHLNEHGNIKYGNHWFKYINEYTTSSDEGQFHLIDLFLKGISLQPTVKLSSLPENLPNLHYDNLIQKPNEDYICVQTCSSDIKKMYNSDSWVNALQLFHFFSPKIKIVLLAAANEEEFVAKIKDKLQEKGIETILACCDLKNVLYLLESAKLLVTLDTSIKHLAIGLELPILEIATGSSHIQHTGSYNSNSLIVNAQVDCFPCGHSSQCSQRSFLCQNIDASVLATSALHLMNKDWISLKHIANEYEDLYEFHRTIRLADNIWYKVNLSADKMEQNLLNILRMSSWKYILDSHLNDDKKSFYKELEILKQVFNRNELFGEVETEKLLQLIETNHLGNELKSQEYIRRLNASTSDTISDDWSEVIDGWLSKVENEAKVDAYRSQLKRIAESNSNKIVKLQAAKDILTNLNEMFRLERKISESLRMEMMG